MSTDADLKKLKDVPKSESAFEIAAKNRSDSDSIKTQKADSERRTTLNDNMSSISDQAFLSALYNTIAMAIFAACLVLCAILYIVLQAFVRPMFWALLTSAFLFSFKRYLTYLARDRLSDIEKRGTLLSIELIVLPFQIIDFYVDQVWLFLKHRIFYLIGFAAAIISFNLISSFYDYVVHYLALCVEAIYKTSNFVTYYSDNSWEMFIALLVIYIIGISFYWSRDNIIIFQILSIPVWLSITFQISKLMGSYRPLFIFIFILLTCLGVFSMLKEFLIKRQKFFDLQDDQEDLIDNYESDASSSSTSHLASEVYMNEKNQNAKSADLNVNSKKTRKGLSGKSSSETTLIKRVKIEDQIESSNQTNSSVAGASDKLESLDEPNANNKQSNESTNSTDSINNEQTDSTSFKQDIKNESTDCNNNKENIILHWILKPFKLIQAAPQLSSIFSYQQSSDSGDSNKKSLNNENSKPIEKNLKFERRRRHRENSDKYFILLFWLLVTVKLRYDLYIVIPFLVIVWKLVKNGLFYLYSTIIQINNVKEYTNLAFEWLECRSTTVMPPPFILFMKLFIKGDHKINQWLQKSMNALVSALMIVSLLLFVLIGFVILTMQVQSESLQLISIVSNIMNENVYSKPELRSWLPEKEKLNQIYQTGINNFYIYSREWLSTRLRSQLLPSSSNDPTSLINSGNNSNYLALESQILQHLDSLYAYLSRKATNLTNLTNNSYQESLNASALPPLSVPTKATTVDQPTSKSTFWGIKRSISLLKNESLDYKNLIFIVRDNLGMFLSIADSLYVIVKGNINLLSTILFTVVSTIFSSGFALMNFFFSFIVYLTALFYLLSISDSVYKPLQWLTELITLNSEFSILSISRSYLLSVSIEESIRGVFVASFKMASFYGLFTYTIYNLFGVNIVYLPSIVAGFLGFLPLLGTYWASLPGILELWLIQHKPLQAILFFTIHIIPTYFVDKAVYSEIKGGHPYLTGLAFAGGVYCLGLEGAIIGPIVLILLIVIGKMITTATARSKSSTSSLNKNIQLLKTFRSIEK